MHKYKRRHGNERTDCAGSDKFFRNGKKRIDEIDRIISRLYEDNIFGKISDERYIKMAGVYETEQKTLTLQISDDEKRLTEMKQ